jgi:hypothetical protein
MLIRKGWKIQIIAHSERNRGIGVSLNSDFTAPDTMIALDDCSIRVPPPRGRFWDIQVTKAAVAQLIVEAEHGDGKTDAETLWPISSEAWITTLRLNQAGNGELCITGWLKGWPLRFFYGNNVQQLI